MEIQDISLTGLRLRIQRTTLRLDPEAQLGPAAACVQKRLGSRFIIEIPADGERVETRRPVGLVRLVLADGQDDPLDLGCVFDRPMSAADLEALQIKMPQGETEGQVRQRESWDEQARAPLDPGVLEGTVDRLFVPFEEEARTDDDAKKDVIAVLHSAKHAGREPLLCVAEDLSASAVHLVVAGESASAWMPSDRDAAAAAVALEAEFGDWPDLEVVEGARRLWRGPARVSGVEVGPGPNHDLRIRLAFSRRLHPAELRRLGG